MTVTSADTAQSYVKPAFSACVHSAMSNTNKSTAMFQCLLLLFLFRLYPLGVSEMQSIFQYLMPRRPSSSRPVLYPSKRTIGGMPTGNIEPALKLCPSCKYVSYDTAAIT